MRALKILLMLCFAAILLGLLAFGTRDGRSSPGAELPKYVRILQVPRDSGSYYECVVYANFIGVAMSCDWDVPRQR